MLLYRKNSMQIVIAFISIIIFSQVSNADIGKETGLEIPRYVSLKSNDANIRVGPSKNYPIKIKYIKKNYPLIVLEEHEEWRRVEDFEKNIGWIHKSLISGNRTGIVLSKNNKNIESELRREILKKATIYQKQTRAKNKSYYPTPKMGGEAN